MPGPAISWCQGGAAATGCAGLISGGGGEIVFGTGGAASRTRSCGRYERVHVKWRMQLRGVPRSGASVGRRRGVGCGLGRLVLRAVGGAVVSVLSLRPRGRGRA